MNLQKKQVIKAFTLVELIVVITILAILGTIAFISLQGYSTSARDSTRVSDISSMKTSLELFQLDAGKYPMPSNSVEITYSGATVWHQGTFGENVFANVDRLDKIPTDPITNKEYTYSITSTKYQYQIGGMIEGDEISINTSQASQKLGKQRLQAQAGTTEATAYVTGNYNEQLTKTLSGSICKVLAVPSIISNDTVVTDLEQILSEQKLVFRGYKNLPASFKTTKFKYDGGFDFTPNQLIAYSDTGSCSELTNPNSSSARVLLLKGLQDSYSGTLLKEHGEIKNILALNINTSSPSSEVINYAGNYVNNALGGNIATSGASSSSSSSSTSSSGGPSGWMLLDTNCDIPDITIGSQTWAGCNSTLGNGVEWGKQDNGTNGNIDTCYNYNGSNSATCTIGSTNMASNTKANTWYSGTNSNGDQEYAAIWGKLYSWNNAGSACPSGRHLPSDSEWSSLEQSLGCSSGDASRFNWGCTGLGWNGHNLLTENNNLANRLKLPLAGNRHFNGFSFFSRGHSTDLWTASAYDATTAYSRDLVSSFNTVYRYNHNKSYNLSVRCIKDTPIGANQSATCSGNLPSNATATNGTTYTQTWNGTSRTPTTSWGENQATCDFSCNSGYNWNGSSCEATWVVLDTNCDIPDITIGSQTWAGCNSTLGTGVERGKRDNGTNGTINSTTGCFPNYNSTNNVTTCQIGSTAMASNTKANTWYTGTNTNGDQEYPSIWGKFYTWANASSACSTGRHLPTESEWETLETTLNGTNCRNSTNGWLCSGLGWLNHNSSLINETNNVADALKIPLSGYRDSDGISFTNRGNSGYLWSSTVYALDTTTAYRRSFIYSNSTVNRNNINKNFGINVRCLKN